MLVVLGKLIQGVGSKRVGESHGICPGSELCRQRALLTAARCPHDDATRITLAYDKADCHVFRYDMVKRAAYCLVRPVSVRADRRRSKQRSD